MPGGREIKTVNSAFIQRSSVKSLLQSGCFILGLLIQWGEWLAWAEMWLLTIMAARSFIKMSSFHVAIIFSYLWKKYLNLWHFYCGFLNPICTIYKESYNIYKVRYGVIPALCWGSLAAQHLPPFGSLLCLGMNCRCDFNMSLLRGRTHFRLTIVLALDCHYIIYFTNLEKIKHCL